MRTLALTLLLVCAADAGTYYVDCAHGSDADSGTAPEAAWKTPSKVSASMFAPGDSILFRRGGRCEGPLRPKGSGNPGRPIRLGAYGEGPLPFLNAGEAEAAFQLVDQQYWEIENLETAGGNPYGVRIAATAGPRTLRHFVLRNLVVHGVRGTPKRKASGLVVIEAANGVGFQDILVDGVTAFGTSQWAGIYVSGSDVRARDVTVRNSIVRDVDGDGIVLFRVENGRIEKSAAWRTGLQERDTIGSPNAIWTWTCRNCIVENTEGFWVDSPSVDGGVYDIDWGNDENVVQRNYGHDAQGYCAAIFGAGRLVTTNSTIRYNVCVNNGRSPKLARRQGDLYTATWDGGSLDGIRIEHNTVIWNPPIDAPAVQMSDTEFSGTRPNIVSDNLIYSTVSSMVRSAAPVRFDRNVYWHTGDPPARWSYGEREYLGFAKWSDLSPRDLWLDPLLDWVLRPREAKAGALAVRASAGSPRNAPPELRPSKEKWLLALLAGKAATEARSQLVFIQAALAQYGGSGLEARVVADCDANLKYDWNFGDVHCAEGSAASPAPAVESLPVLLLISPAGQVLGRWEGFAPPAELGLTLKHFLGPARGDPPVPLGNSKP
jgi:hypothetical protein